MKPFRKAATAHRRIKSLRYLRWEIGLKGRGLSGEHIELCAEGARRPEPNLSGKWTETRNTVNTVSVGSSPQCGLLVFIVYQKIEIKEGWKCTENLWTQFEW